MASKLVYGSMQGGRHQWGEIVIQAEAAIRAEAAAEEAEAEVEALLGFWKKVKEWVWCRNRNRTRRPSAGIETERIQVAQQVQDLGQSMSLGEWRNRNRTRGACVGIETERVARV